MRASFRTRLLLNAAMLSLFCAALPAQTVGTLYGVVVAGPGEREFPAIVTVRLSGFEYERTVHAVSGRFSFQSVRGGYYVITVSADGRRTVSTEIHSWSPADSGSEITVELGDDARPAPGPEGYGRGCPDTPGPDSAKRQLAKAGELLTKSDYEKALEHIDKALKICPGYYQAYNNKGVVYVRMKRLDEAERAFFESAQLQPESALSQKNLGLVRLSEGRHKEALEPLFKAASLDPDDADTKAYLGEALYLEGRVDEAREQLEAALTLKPTIETANYRLGRIYLEAGLLRRGSEVLQVIPATGWKKRTRKSSHRCQTGTKGPLAHSESQDTLLLAPTYGNRVTVGQGLEPQGKMPADWDSILKVVQPAPVAAFSRPQRLALFGSTGRTLRCSFKSSVLASSQFPKGLIAIKVLLDPPAISDGTVPFPCSKQSAPPASPAVRRSVMKARPEPL